MRTRVLHHTLYVYFMHASKRGSQGENWFITLFRSRWLSSHHLPNQVDPQNHLRSNLILITIKFTMCLFQNSIRFHDTNQCIRLSNYEYCLWICRQISISPQRCRSPCPAKEAARPLLPAPKWLILSLSSGRVRSEEASLLLLPCPGGKQKSNSLSRVTRTGRKQPREPGSIQVSPGRTEPHSA